MPVWIQSEEQTIGSSEGVVAIISIYLGGLVITCQPTHTFPVIFVGFYKTMIISFDTYGNVNKYTSFGNWINNRVSKGAL